MKTGHGNRTEGGSRATGDITNLPTHKDLPLDLILGGLFVFPHRPAPPSAGCLDALG